MYNLEWYYYWKITTLHHHPVFLYNIELFHMNIATIKGSAEQSCITWSGITVVKLPNHATAPPSVPLEYRAIPYYIARLQGRAE